MKGSGNVRKVLRMPSQTSIRIGSSENLAEIKAISGWAIERRRLQIRLKQEDLASRASITSRWIREIEGGNPKSTLDDHLRCAAALDLSVGFLAIPMLYMERHAKIPRELLLPNLAVIEEQCIKAVSGHILDALRHTMGSDPKSPDYKG